MNAFTKSFTVKLVGVTLRPDGGLGMRFTTHPHDFVSADDYRDYLGQSFMMGLVLIDENEQPAGAAEAAANPSKGGQAHLRDSAAQEPPAPVRHPSLVEQAGALCADKEFWLFLEKRWGAEGVLDKNHAAEMLRFAVGVKSRKEIVPDSEAAVKFKQLREEFEWWRLYVT